MSVCVTDCINCINLLFDKIAELEIKVIDLTLRIEDLEDEIYKLRIDARIFQLETESKG